MPLQAGRPPLRVVPNPDHARQERTGGAVLEKLRTLNLQKKREAKRELLKQLTDHYSKEPNRQVSHWQVVERLLVVGAELETDSLETAGEGST